MFSLYFIDPQRYAEFEEKARMYPALMSLGMFGLVIVSGFNFSVAMEQMAAEVEQQRRGHPHLT